MLLTNRLYERRKPFKEAKSIYIFCEGKKREYQYFRYFKELDSRINIEIYKLKSIENNSPTGLLEIAEKSVLRTDTNPEPKYEFIDGDELWFVIDTDLWGEKITELKQSCTDRKGWNVAISNPCFEVWLYYHKFETKPELNNIQDCSAWKKLVNISFPGGFDSRRYPVFIKEAIKNSLDNYSEKDWEPLPGSTTIPTLAESFYPFVKDVIHCAMQRVLNNDIS